MRENLVYDNIKDFKPGQSIYLRIATSPGFNQTFECEFIEIKAGVVHAKVVSTDTNKSLYERRIADGWIAAAKVSNCALYGKTANSNHASYHWFDATGYAAYEKVEKMQEHMPKEHESYGVIGFTRSQSNMNKSLFGSSIKHHNTIVMRISSATLDRNLNNDYVHSGKNIVEIEMSETQFAQAITMFNRGDGTPVTIRKIGDNNMEACPFVSKVDQFNAEFQHNMKELEHDIKLSMQKATEILTSGKAPTKGERELILKTINSLMQQISSNIPFVAQQFNEQMDKTVTEAKKEIERFLVNKALELGIDAPDNSLKIE
jgi:hypothetical protein